MHDLNNSLAQTLYEHATMRSERRCQEQLLHGKKGETMREKGSAGGGALSLRKRAFCLEATWYQVGELEGGVA